MAITTRNAGIASILFAILVWSGWMVLSSYSVRGNLTAYDITALRFGTAGLVMLPVFLKKGMRVGPYGRWGALWLTLLMGATYNTLCIIGMKHAATSHASIIQTTVLILSTLGGVFLLRERFTKLQGFGVLLSVIGILCLLESGRTQNPTQWIGHGLFILGGAMWATYTISMRQWRADPIQVAACISVISATLFLPIYWLYLPSNLTSEHWHEAAFQGVYQGIVNSVFALICYNRAVACLGASTTSAFLPLIPVIACLMAMPILHEFPSPAEWSGILLAAVGVVLATGVVGRLLIGNSARNGADGGN